MVNHNCSGGQVMLPTSHIPPLGDVLTASPLARRKLGSWCWTPVTEWPAKLHTAGTGKSQISGGGGKGGGRRERAKLQEKEVILLPELKRYQGPHPDGAWEERRAVSLSSLHHTPLFSWTQQGAEFTCCPHGIVTTSEITPSQNSFGCWVWH